MKYTILPYDDTLTQGLSRYIVDEVSDIEDLPGNIQAGSKVIVANTGETYLLNNSHEWRLQPTAEGGSSGEGASQEEVAQTIETVLATKGYATESYVSSAIPDVSGFYTKPQNGIPATDLASGVIPNLNNYVLKSNPEFTGALSLGRRSYTGKGTKSTALGTNVEASGENSVAVGYFAAATAPAAHAEGSATHADGEASHAEGRATYAMAQNSHAEG